MYNKKEMVLIRLQINIHIKKVWINNKQLAKDQITSLVDLKICGYIVNSFIFPSGLYLSGGIRIGATSPIRLTYKYLPLIEVISSAPNISHIACHLRIPIVLGAELTTLQGG